MKRVAIFLIGFGSLLWLGSALADRPRVSEDRELKEIDLSGWDCLNRAGGSAKTPDGVERNGLKNRPATNPPRAAGVPLDSAAFLRRLAEFDALSKGKRRKELTGAERAKLAPLEKEAVTLTGYLVLAYAGPPESTNCASSDFHDWHLEIFAQPLDHPPGVGDPTPIICEITPRTQNAIYQAGVRLQALAAFIRGPDLNYEPTGHPARKVRLTGYLLWDDEHNGSADVGTAIRSFAVNKYHNPWRSTAWELHPVLSIEPLETVPSDPGGGSNTVATSPSASAAPATTPAGQFVTLTRPVTIKIPYGQTVLPRGLRLPIVSRTGENVTVQYMGRPQAIPLAATQLQSVPPSQLPR